MKRLWFAWIALLFITAGCASLNPYKVAEKNPQLQTAPYRHDQGRGACGDGGAGKE